MKGFDHYYQRAQVELWKEHYINYVCFKELIHQYHNGSIEKTTKLQQQQQHLRPGRTQSVATAATTTTTDCYHLHPDHDHQYSPPSPPSSSSSPTSSSLQPTPQTKTEYYDGSNDHHDASRKDPEDDFLVMLQQEVGKATNFYHQTLVVLKQELDFTLSLVEKERENSSDHDDEQQKQLMHLSIKLLQLYSFVVANMITLRQICLRYDAYKRTYHGTDEKKHKELDGDYICPGIEVDLLSSMAIHLPEAFDLQPLQDMISQVSFNLQQQDDKDQLEYHVRHIQTLLDTTYVGWHKSIFTGHMTKRDRFLSTLRHFVTVSLGSSSFGGFISLEPKILMMNKGRHLKYEMKLLAKWNETTSKQGLLFLRPSQSQKESSNIWNEMDPANVWPLILNMTSCFLHMMNNYIIEPSSAYYAEALGSSDAISGIMIGAASWLALVSAIVYSVWTNTSYRKPTIVAGILMVIGNTLYASAFSFESIEICLLGRAISGLGAPRIINRRYVADATPFSLRTISSAGFALFTALGAALGPGMAIVLDIVPEFSFHLPILGKQYFNGMTGPGFFMAMLWLIYTFAVVFTFQEPNRSGLDELKRREQQQENQQEHQQMQQRLQEENDRHVAVAVESFVDDDYDDDDSTSTTATNHREDGTSEKVSKHNPIYCIKHMTRATALCMGLIFMKRIALESIVGSTSVITKNRYGWSIQNVGTLHLVNGLIVIPISIFAGWLSHYYKDRRLAIWFMTITALGMLVMVDFTDLIDHETNSDTYNEDLWLSVGPIRYIIGSLIAFSGIEACESFVASLMSKVVPSALAVGTFNSGLLATLVGTGGRAVGDAIITAMGLISIRNLLNLLIIPGLALMLLSIYLLRRNYGIVGL